MGYQTKSLNDLLDELDSNIKAAEVDEEVTNGEDITQVENAVAIEDLRHIAKQLRACLGAIDLGAVDVRFNTP